jgi:hypothetical protein
MQLMRDGQTTWVRREAVPGVTIHRQGCRLSADEI